MKKKTSVRASFSLYITFSYYAASSIYLSGKLSYKKNYYSQNWRINILRYDTDLFFDGLIWILFSNPQNIKIIK